MSAYESRAWRSLVEQAQKPASDAGRYEALPEGEKARLRSVADRAGRTVKKMPGADQLVNGLDAATQKALAGLHVIFIERGLHSVRPTAIFGTFAKEGVTVSSYDDIRDLDLQYCDQTVPRRKERYLLLAAGQGALTAATVTGAEVSSTVSGGTTVGVAVGAVAVDVSAVLVGMGRSGSRVCARDCGGSRVP